MRAMTASAMAARPVATPSARASSDSSDVNTRRHRGRGAVRPLRGERSGLAFASNARRRIAEAPRALSDPVETESKAERFLREQLEREGVDVDAAVAPESPEEIVAALEEEVARLSEREASLTRDLDAAYRDTFADLVVRIPSSTAGDEGDEGEAPGDAPRTRSFRCPKDIDEASFRAIAADDAPAASALLDAAQRGDQAKWLSFQRNAHMAKLQRDRVVAQKAAVQAEAVVAKRGGGAVAAAKAAAEAARDAAAESASARAADGSDVSTGEYGAVGETRRIVLISGFESFNVKLYRRTARNLAKRCPGVELAVFSDRDVAANRDEVAAALDGAEVFFGSLLFDFDQVEWLRDAVAKIPTRFVFESALELMSETSVGSFEMKPAPDGAKAGPPPAVKAILAKFGSGKEEDKLVGYLSFLKLGPALLKFVPGRKAKDLRNWLTVYGYWNQGGLENVEEAFYYVAREYLPGLPEAPPAVEEDDRRSLASGVKKAVRVVVPTAFASEVALKPPKETPALGFYHPDIELARAPWPETVGDYLRWYDARDPASSPFGHTPLPADAPTVAVLLYRKHVITQQPYLADLVRALEASGVKPVPIFINGVEAHTVVRDLLTTEHEQARRDSGSVEIDSLRPDACVVDAVVSTVGFPLVGGPAGSMEAGRQAEVAQAILTAKNVPYVVAAPLLIQDIKSWTESGVGGLQSTILYALPELDGAIDSVPLGGLCGDDIFLTRERVYALADRLKKWHALRRKKKSDRKLAVMLYGFPPGVGATGTAALLNVPKSLEQLLERLRDEGYDLGLAPDEPVPSGEALVEALRALDDGRVVAGGVEAARAALETLRAEKLAASSGPTDESSDLSARDPLRGVAVAGENVSAKRLKEWISFPENWGPTEFGPIPFLPTPDVLVRRMEQAWGPLEAYNGLATTQGKDRGSYVAGLTVGNVFIGVQPALGVEGDPMRLLFERDLTPHPQYAAYYKWLQKAYAADAVLHFGMHGTVEWLPGSPLGNTCLSWSDQLLGAMPNVYVYAANNPSESIVAKRRGYGVIVSHNVPPYGRAGLYRQTAELRELLAEYREAPDANFRALAGPVFDLVASAGLDADVPFRPSADSGRESAEAEAPRVTSETARLVADTAESEEEDAADEDAKKTRVTAAAFEAYAGELFAYLGVLENRLFSEGLHVLGGAPSDEAAEQYLEAYFGDSLAHDTKAAVARSKRGDDVEALRASLERALAADVALPDSEADRARSETLARLDEALEIRELLRRNTEELSGALRALDGEYLPPAAGGDLLRDGPGVLPTGRNIHALDPYRMPSPAAADRGKRIAQALLAQHRAANDGAFPETVSVNLWGLDAIKTKGESVGIVLELIGARAVKEGTGRVARYELIPLDELEPPARPRIDVLCNMSGIFRDSFANVVGLLDDAFARAAEARDEPLEKNFVRKHALEMRADGLENASARLFSNPPGDYGSMVNERVGTSEWEDGRELGDTWASRNAYSYGRGGERGAARPEVLQALLRTTERVVQEIDSVEYDLTDLQEYYANTGALVAAANAAKEEAEEAKAAAAGTPAKAIKKTACSVVETFGEDVAPRDLDETLRLEYRSKLLNPRWAEAMADQGSGGAFEISQRMTALIGWGATSGFTENWVYDGAHERYVADEAMRDKLRRANPQAFRNVLKRMLEAAGRGMWDADEETLQELRALYSETEDELEGVRTRP